MDENYRLYISLKERTLKKLKEFYIKYDMDWVDEFVEDLYSDMSNTEMKLKWNFIKLDFEPTRLNRLVVMASFNEESKNYKIVLNNKIFESEPEDRYKEELKIEIKQNLVHEDTHRQQSQGDSTKRDHPDANDDSYKVLSVPQEIDARARELGRWFEDHGITDIQEVIGKIETNNVDDQFQDVIAIYQEIGGSVYHKLLSEVYRYIMNEEDW